MADNSPIRIEFELSEGDMDYFRKRLLDARARHGEDTEVQIIAAADALAKRSTEEGLPDFMKSRIETLKTMIAMLQDQDWRLEGEDRQYVINALVYFADPHDMIPDEIPGVGFLDDAIMIDLAARELDPEVSAYIEFCENRDELAEGVEDAQPLEESRH
ncbi:MAG: YkvA family protein, partial [Pseudomonadota bacterium]